MAAAEATKRDACRNGSCNMVYRTGDQSNRRLLRTDRRSTDETGRTRTAQSIIILSLMASAACHRALGQGFNNPFRSFVAAMFGEEHGGCIRGEAKGESPGAAY